MTGCPLTDSYYIEASAGAPGHLFISGGSGPGATGGGDAVGGSVPIGGVPGDDMPGGDTAGAGALTGDTGGTGITTGGSPPVGGAGGLSGNGGGAGSGSGTGGDSRGGSGGGTNGGTRGMTAGGPSAGTGGRVGGMGGRAPMGGRASMAGAAGLAGMSGNAGSSGGNEFQPLCDDSIVKGSPCNASSPHLCYRTCGPDSIGFKSETCQGGSYVEQSGCSFPSSADYSCYQIPNRLPAECPTATVPQATEPCQVAQCTVCFGGSPASPSYQDSSGTPKTGYCVCSDTGSWTCASTSSWPCPDGPGCN